MAHSTDESPAPRKARILVVEDDAIVAADIGATLMRLGYAVIGPLGAASEALGVAEAQAPDLVMMDIQTRGELDGIEAAHLLRKRLRMPVVFLTAHSDPETIRRAGMAEPLGYLVKPFKAADLASVVEVALYRHKVEVAMRERDRALEALSARLVAALESLEAAVMLEDEHGAIQHVNRQLASLLEATGIFATARLPQREQVFSALSGLLAHPEQRRLGTFPPLVRRTGHSDELLELRDGRILELRSAGIVAQGEPRGCMWTLRDVTEREGARRQLEELSLVDPLTSLHNRRGLLTLVELLMHTARRERHDLAVFLKPVNDRYGHEMGDHLLQRAAELVRGTFRSADVVARLGGDEFVGVGMVHGEAGASVLLARLRANLLEHNRDHPQLPPVSMSIGVALGVPDGRESFDALLARADAAMYAEKRTKHGRR